MQGSLKSSINTGAILSLTSSETTVQIMVYRSMPILQQDKEFGPECKATTDKETTYSVDFSILKLYMFIYTHMILNIYIYKQTTSMYQGFIDTSMC